MEFIKRNYINTTGSIVVNSNTNASSNIFNPIKSIQYITDGFNNDATTASIRINFTATQTVSRIALQEMNLKSFILFYNGATASTFSLTTTSATTTSNFTTNSQTSMYLFTTPVDCTSVTLDMRSTQSTNAEKAIGYLHISDLLLNFETNGRIPASKNYNPERNRREVRHTMSDGGTRLSILEEKWAVNLKFDSVTLAFKNELKTIFDRREAVVFAAFPTTTAWDNVFFDCVWPEPFNFEEYSDDSANSGFSGSIKLLETS